MKATVSLHPRFPGSPKVNVVIVCEPETKMELQNLLTKLSNAFGPESIATIPDVVAIQDAKEVALAKLSAADKAILGLV